MSIPSIVELAGVFENPGNLFQVCFFENLVLHGVLELPEICSREACEGQMKVYNRLKPYLYRCSRKRTCGMYLSVYKDSFFGSTRLPANKVLLIAYLWLTKSLNTAMVTYFSLRTFHHHLLKIFDVIDVVIVGNTGLGLMCFI